MKKEIKAFTIVNAKGKILKRNPKQIPMGISFKNCSLCGQETERQNRLGQCPLCSKKGEWAKNLTTKGRIMNYKNFCKILKVKRFILCDNLQQK